MGSGYQPRLIVDLGAGAAMLAVPLAAVAAGPTSAERWVEMQATRALGRPPVTAG